MGWRSNGAVLVAGAALAWSLMAEAGASEQSICKQSGLCMWVRGQDQNSVLVQFIMRDIQVTHFNYKRPGGVQGELGHSGRVQLVRYGPDDAVEAQWCIRATLGRSECGRWESFALPQLAPAETKSPPAGKRIKVLGKKRAPSAAERCVDGFVWREARSGDVVCVTPEARARTAEENRRAAARRDPGGAYGPESCTSGYVWREAFQGDTVCVTPEIRTLVREENSHAASRRVGG